MATEADAHPKTGTEPTQRTPFVRQASGLVREVSPLNALFFNVAAFVGTIISFSILQYSVSFEPEWQFLGLTAYAWAAIAVGGACVLLALIYISLTTVMPRTGGDYVFTSRIISPFLGWLESWTLAWGSLALIAVVLPVTVLQISFAGVVMHAAFPDSSMWDGASGWFTSQDGSFIAGTVVLLLATAFAMLPPRIFHRILTWLGIFALSSAALLLLFTLLFVSKGDFLSNLPAFTDGQGPAEIIKTAAYPTGGFSFAGFMIIAAIVFLAYIGFQYSAYIAGEVAGNVRRTTYFALFGALAIAVFMHSFYNDLLGHKFGVDLVTSWGSLFWAGGELPGGAPPLAPILASVASPDLWPIWLFAMVGALLFTFLLIPVYMVFITRIFLAWGLDRQAPEWFSRVNERTHVPINGLLTCVVISWGFLYLTSYQGLQLASTIWFSTLLLALTWVVPGFNAIFAKRRRPQAFASAPYARYLPWIGLAWLICSITIYVVAVFRPIVQALTESGADGSQYIKDTGILAFLITLGVGVVVYLINLAWERRRNVDRAQVFAEIPPS